MTKEEFERLLADAEEGRDYFACKPSAIAEHYRLGDVEDVGRDLSLALRWYSRAYREERKQEAERGPYFALAALSHMGEVFFELGEYGKAIRCFNVSFEDHGKVSYLARCYLFGLGVPQDTARGEALLLKAGSTSLLYLAELYARGELFPKDEARARELYVAALRAAVEEERNEPFLCAFEKTDEAADGGDAAAQLALGEYFFSQSFSMLNAKEQVNMLRPNGSCGAYWLLRAKRQGSAAAAEMLGEKFETDEAAEAAAEVYERARRELKGPDGTIWALGEALARKLVEPQAWFWETIERAAELGNAEAQYHSGLHRLRMGDEDEGLGFLVQAALQGHEGALGECESHGVPLTDLPLEVPPAGGMLSVEEMQALPYRRTIFVAGNEKLGKIVFRRIYGGRGGSNTAGAEEASRWEVDPASLNGTPPYWAFGTKIVAVVGDVVYLAVGHTITPLTFGRSYTRETEVSYDSYEWDTISLEPKE